MKKIKACGTPHKKEFIPLCVPNITGNEWKYVKECLDTNWVSSAGAYIDKFEKMVAESVGAKHAIATVNGTAALHVSLLLLGIGSDDEVVMSDMTFVAPANAVIYTGAAPVFIDADHESFQMDTGKLEDFLKRGCRSSKRGLVNRKTGRRVKAIMPVHILGHCCGMDEIEGLAANFGLEVVEDATEALGSRYKGMAAGTFGRLGTFSFNGNKIITTGGGGMIVTDDRKLADKAKYLTTQAKNDAVEFIHDETGFNYRLPNVLSAMGCAQMERLDSFVDMKRKIAKRYEKELSGVPGVTVMTEPENNRSTFWLYTVKIDRKEFGMDRKELMRELGASGIETRPLWQPMHLLKPFRSSQFHGGKVSELLKKECLSLPCSTGLKSREQDEVIGRIRELSGEIK